jgi:hypothetical protein
VEKTGYYDQILYDSGGGVYVAVSKCRKITWPKKTNSRVPFTHLRSPNRTGEYKVGFGEYSALQAEAIYNEDEVSHGQILADGDSGVQRTWKAERRNSADDSLVETWSFTGSVGEAGISDSDNETPQLLVFSINVDGAVTRA